MAVESQIALFRREFASLRRFAERALAQVSDDDFFVVLGPSDNSLAVMVKHLAGNLRSRWRAFLTTDGEKPDRDRDGEFEVTEGEARAALMEAWEEGWGHLAAALDPLTDEDLVRSVTIRGEAFTVLQAIQRQISHYAFHVGQIVFLAKHLAGTNWKSLTIPKGASKSFNAAPQSYLEPETS